MPDRKSPSNPRKAVSLGYEHGKDPVPHVLAKGEGVAADEIIRLAKELGVPICENESLVESLLRLDYQQDIPEELFTVVAEILAFAYEIMGRSPESPGRGSHR